MKTPNTSHKFTVRDKKREAKRRQKNESSNQDNFQINKKAQLEINTIYIYFGSRDETESQEL